MDIDQRENFVFLHSYRFDAMGEIFTEKGEYGIVFEKVVYSGGKVDAVEKKNRASALHMGQSILVHA